MKFFISLIAAALVLSGCGLFGGGEFESVDQNGPGFGAVDIGQKFECNDSDWMTPELLKTWNESSREILTASKSKNSPRVVLEGKLYSLNFSNSVEGEMDSLNVPVADIEAAGYSGAYGGYVSFTPKASGRYRIAGTKFWQSFSVPGGSTLIAVSYINNCAGAINKIVEWNLEKGKTYIFQAFKSASPGGAIYIYRL